MVGFKAKEDIGQILATLAEADTRGAQSGSTSPFFRLSKFFFSEQLALSAAATTTTTTTILLLLLLLLLVYSIIDDIVQNGAPLPLI